eukprot:scaffold238804_cov29-Attheya_sp.AAC.1
MGEPEIITSPTTKYKRQRPAPATLDENPSESDSTTTFSNAQCLPPPHVASICAPDHRAEVPDSNELAVEDNRCTFWPICKKINEVCGGKTKELCLVYGLNGTMQMPSVEELDYRQYRLKIWDNKSLESRCAWAPCCEKLAVECGGIQRKKCSTYGENGKKDPPTNAELQTRRRQLRAQQEADRRKKKVTDHHSSNDT